MNQTQIKKLKVPNMAQIKKTVKKFLEVQKEMEELGIKISDWNFEENSAEVRYIARFYKYKDREIPVAEREWIIL